MINASRLAPSPQVTIAALAVAFWVVALRLSRESMDVSSPGSFLLHLPHLAWLAVTAVAASYALFYAVMAASLYRGNRGLLGPAHAPARELMKVILGVAEVRYLIRFGRVLLAQMGALAAVAAAATRHIGFLSFAALSAAVLSWLWLRVTVPPSVVVLGASGRLSVSLHWKLKRIISPLRVLSLLDLGHAGGEGRRSELTLDCLRTSNEEDWLAAVAKFLKVTRLVVVDGRVSSPWLIQEVTDFLGDGFARPCVIIGAPGRGCPLLQSLPPDIARRWEAVSEPEALEAVVRNLRRLG